ncbi:MAG: RNA 2',3'-cyclic phosphodiesterase, partial [Alphaproteobacteria bacterium]|nr:RNA 2',3'-cyclic phosphodiesterase [Alphaproteobacteria bacterium]
MLRLFVALPLPREISSQLKTLSGGLPNARWIPEENYHLTLRFIGSVNSHQADDIDAALSLIGEPIVDVRLNGFGHFGKKGLANCLIATA